MLDEASSKISSESGVSPSASLHIMEKETSPSPYQSQLLGT